MATKKKTTTKPKPSKATVATQSDKPRQLKPSKKARWRVKKNQRAQTAALPNGFKVLKKALRTLATNWRLFGSIILVYLVLSIVLVGSLAAGGNLGDTKEQLEVVEAGQLDKGVTIATSLIGTGNSGEGGSAYQSVVLVVVSLATIWALRQAMAGKRASLRDSFYKGMYPLVPFVLVLLATGLQLLPALVGVFLFSALGAAGVLGNPVLGIGALVMLCGLLYVSLYLLSSSVFALYVVTLPDTRPFGALRTARQLVKYRRFSVIRKLLLLPFLYFIVGALLMVPIALYLTPLAPLLFLILTMFGFTIAHAYLYTLYRELYE
ncbi:MAG TPA: hypothetical protein VK694_03900 [Verrucomicrobiae bacterium]|nr:hypothetical protein [Verrucomicrobiae bacterium]